MQDFQYFQSNKNSGCHLNGELWSLLREVLHSPLGDKLSRGTGRREAETETCPHIEGRSGQWDQQYNDRYCLGLGYIGLYSIWFYNTQIPLYSI